MKKKLTLTKNTTKKPYQAPKDVIDKNRPSLNKQLMLLESK